jgi:hypothetical protein
MKESYRTLTRISSKTVILNINLADTAGPLHILLKYRIRPGGIKARIRGSN